jgi:methionyl-tRNA formyltransferase
MPSEESLDHAPKITTEDKQIQWRTSTAISVERQARALGPLWTRVDTYEDRFLHQKPLRITLEDISATTETPPVFETSPKILEALELFEETSESTESVFQSDWTHVAVLPDQDGKAIWVHMPKGGYLRVGRITVAGRKSQDAWSALQPFCEDLDVGIDITPWPAKTATFR